MAEIAAGASALGGSASVSVRALPPYWWVVGAAVLGVAILAWHTYAIDDEDTSWLDPQQPPENVDVAPSMTALPTASGGVALGGPAMRGRQKPTFLDLLGGV